MELKYRRWDSGLGLIVLNTGRRCGNKRYSLFLLVGQIWVRIGILYQVSPLMSLFLCASGTGDVTPDAAMRLGRGRVGWGALNMDGVVYKMDPLVLA